MRFYIIVLFALFFLGCNSQPKSDFDIDKVLLKSELSEKLILISNHLNIKCDYGNKIELLNSSERVFYLIDDLERAINNGGFNSFYYNSSGNFANETQDALLKIGAKFTSELVKKGNDEFENGIVPKNQIERQNVVIDSKESEKKWERLDSEFYEYKDNLSELLIDFVVENKKDFQ